MFKDQTYFPYLQNIGVVIFFLLSGFLMALSLENKNQKHEYTFLMFFKHKTIRISREYIPGLILIACIDYISILINAQDYGYYKWFNIEHFIGNIFMLQSMGPYAIFSKVLITFGSGRPLWCLSVEWWFYMLFGAAYIYIANKKKLTLSKILVLGVSIFMSSGYLINGRGNGLGMVFTLGMLCYYSYYLIDNRKLSVMICLLSVMLYTVYGVVCKEAYTIYSFIILWIFLSASLRCTGGNTCALKRNKVLAFISKSTFMLYLIHYSIIDFIYTWQIDLSIYSKFYIGIIISLLCSFLAYYIFGEKRLLERIITKAR